jgi:nucleotide-binding universal stress UspA family protein
MNFKKILLPIDINDSSSWKKTLHDASELLRNNSGSRLHILYVVPNFSLGLVEEYFPKGWLKDISEKALVELDRIVKKYIDVNETGMNYELHIARGVVYKVILEKAAELDADLIVMSSGNPSSKDYLLGPNVARVSRHAEASILIKR